MSTYAALVGKDLPVQIKNDLTGWNDGQILQATEDQIVEILHERYRYKPIRFVEGSERSELLKAGEPAAGIRIHFEFDTSSGQPLPEFLAIQPTHHRGEPRLDLDGTTASFVVRPMGSAQQVQETLDAIKSNVAARNSDIEKGNRMLLQHTQNIYRERAQLAESNQAAGQRARSELDKLGIPDMSIAAEVPPVPASSPASASTVSEESTSEIDGRQSERPGEMAVHPVQHSLVAPLVGKLNPSISRIRDLVEDILERSPDEFTASVCSEILKEVEAVDGFLTGLNGAPDSSVELPQSLFNAGRIFDWLGGAIIGKGVDHLDELATELAGAGDTIAQLLEFVANPPV